MEYSPVLVPPPHCSCGLWASACAWQRFRTRPCLHLLPVGLLPVRPWLHAGGRGGADLSGLGELERIGTDLPE